VGFFERQKKHMTLWILDREKKVFESNGKIQG